MRRGVRDDGEEGDGRGVDGWMEWSTGRCMAETLKLSAPLSTRNVSKSPFATSCTNFNSGHPLTGPGLSSAVNDDAVYTNRPFHQ